VEKHFFRIIGIMFTIFGLFLMGNGLIKSITKTWTPDYSNQPQHTLSPKIIEFNQTLPIKTSYNFDILNEFNASQINYNERKFGEGKIT